MYVLLTGGVALVPMRHLEHRNATPFSKIMTPFLRKKCYICAMETKSLKIKELKNMKTKLYMIALAAISMILALSSCSESEDLLSAFHSDPNAVRITAQVGKASADGFTRSFPLGDAEKQKEFKEDDEISVQADGQDAVTYKLVGSEWQPQGNKFLKWESDKMNFTAYYPASYKGGTITQPTEYTSEADLAAADFMSFSGPQTNTNKSNNLTLTMERKMARVVVEIDGFNDQYAGATIDNINSLSICGIKAYKHTDNKFYALIKPCAAQNSATFLSLDVAEGESKTTTETLTGIPELTAGNSYTYQLTVGKDKVSVSGITVKDWTTGDITGGKTEECPTPYVTFTAEEAQTFKMTTTGTYEIKGLEYSVNNGDWATVKAGTEVPFGGTNGDLRLRGINPNGTANGSTRYSTITFTDPTVDVACIGDIRTLQDWRNSNIVETNNARFCFLFLNCSVLTSAPELPATTLANYCYRDMFKSCTKLTSTPELPATTLANYCYSKMFYGCTSLTSAPVLPATTLAVSCYSGMFDGCTKLTSAPKLSATKLADYCYYEMFHGCTSLTSAPKLSAIELANACYCKMFYGCKNLSSVTMLAPSDQILKETYCCTNWLYDAGTDASVTSRTLKVTDEAAYTALERYLPDNWKKNAAGTTVKKEDNTEIK